MAGLRAWLAQLDRRLGLRTYVIGAIAVLALAAGVVALVLTLQLRQDAATNDDVSSVRKQLSGVQLSVTRTAEKSVQSLQRRVADLEAEIERISSARSGDRRELKALQGDLKALQEKVKGLRDQIPASKSGSTPANPTP